jgi:hypothetical protein
MIEGEYPKSSLNFGSRVVSIFVQSTRPRVREMKPKKPLVFANTDQYVVFFWA